MCHHCSKIRNNEKLVQKPSNEEIDQNNKYWDEEKIRELNQLEQTHSLKKVDIDTLYYFLTHKKFWVLYLEYLISLNGRPGFKSTIDNITKQDINEQEQYKQQLQILHKYIQLREWTHGHKEYANDKQLIELQKRCDHFNIVSLDGHYNNYFCHNCKIYLDYKRQPMDQAYWNNVLKDLPPLNFINEDKMNYYDNTLINRDVLLGALAGFGLGFATKSCKIDEKIIQNFTDTILKSVASSDVLKEFINQLPALSQQDQNEKKQQ